VELVGQLVTFKILSAGSARAYLVKKGFTDMFDAREGELVLAESTAAAAAAVGDPALAGRTREEETPETEGAGDGGDA
jgi:hypothetical protein